ncbi:hypothetical protein PUN28_010853 [Cardiocondyla obscurior]
MADYYGNGLVVYNSVKDSMCRIESKYMEPVDDLFVLKNHDTFIYPAGIFSMTVICNECKTSCYLYWAPISGKAIYRTDIDHLLNCPNKDQANNKTKYTIKLASQTVDMESVDHTLYYSDTGAMSIVRRNVCKLSSQSKPVTVTEEMQPVLGVVTTMSSLENGKEMQFIEDNYKIFKYTSVDLSSINFRYCRFKI